MASFRISKSVYDNEVFSTDILTIPQVVEFPTFNQPGSIVYNSVDDVFYGLGATAWQPFSNDIDPNVGFSIFNAGPIVLTGSTAIFINFGTSAAQTYSYLNSNFDGTIFTVGQTGIYTIFSTVFVIPGTTGITGASIIGTLIINGSAVIGESITTVAPSANIIYKTGNNYHLNSGDTIQVRLVVNTINATIVNRNFSIQLVKKL